MQIHVRKDIQPDFEAAAEQFRSEHRSESQVSPIMVACFLERFGLTPEIREQARKEIEYITARLGL